ncbi:BA14K family protein [Devosia sp. LjRoot3]|uniref:BA14K family protein n=1 Tax=Devosia sp. LjRoot3 TaxID=3342319 RepID=UPI003ECEE2CF
MRKLAGLASGLAMSGILALSAVVPAQAQSVTMSFGQRYQVIETYCDRNPWDPDCQGFYGGGWDDRDYNNFYYSRRSSIDNIASGILGFTFGAAIGSIIANGNNNTRGGVVVYGGNNYDAHVQACYNRYRSYDEETDSFLGYDGIRHRCNL